MRTRRYASLWLPNWPAQRLLRCPRGAPSEPFVVAGTSGAKRLVRALSPGAEAAGLRAGATVALAQASVPDLTVVEADEEADGAALARLAIWALRVSPLSAPEPPDGLVIDIGGTRRLHGEEADILARLLRRLEKAGFCVSGAVSGSRLLSRALARLHPCARGEGLIVAADGEAEAAAPLPVAGLGLDLKTERTLERLGLKRVGQLLSAPRSGLALRFGMDLIARLDRICGHEPEVLEPVTAPELVFSEASCAEPVAHSAGVDAAFAKLAEALRTRLEERGEGARVLDLRCHRVDGDVVSLRVGAARPTRDPSHMKRLFKERLDKVDPGFGIERMTLVAAVTERTASHQTDTDKEEAQDLSLLLDRIGARLGEARIFRMEPTESDVPERSFEVARPLAPPARTLWDRTSRPVQLIVPPQRIEVLALLPDHPPARFTFAGRQHRVRRADGPECIFGEWWRSDGEIALTRDYYRVEDEEGGRWWLYRARGISGGPVEWFVHGVFG